MMEEWVMNVSKKMTSAALAPALLVILIGVTLSVPDAEAIPAFARKYRTSCQTCHIAYPKLNAFGQAFRRLGYRMPAETEDMIKEIPVSLGAPAYKRLWPDSVWPSDIPGTVPLSLNTVLTNLSERTTEDGETTTIKNDFRFPEEVSILSGGTLGETLSFFGEMVFAQEVDGVGVELEHAQLNFNGPFGSGAAFNLKVGRLMPESSQIFGHSYLLTSEGPAVMLMFNPIGHGGGSEIGGEHGGGIALPHGVDGLEAYGILRHRFLYSGGISNGIGPGPDSADVNNAKDVFGRISYKLGGLALDGDGYVASDKNWRERSFEIGVFGYRGDGKGMFFPAHHEAEGGMEPMEQVEIEDPNFHRVGFDANLFFQDLNVLGSYVRGTDTLATYAVEGDERSLSGQGDFSYDAWFIEADYVIMPWLHGALRYEWLKPALEGAPDFKRIVPNVTALIRANVKFYVEYQRNLGESDDYALATSVRLVF
jgi:hypothetical protein